MDQKRKSDLIVFGVERRRIPCLAGNKENQGISDGNI